MRTKCGLLLLVLSTSLTLNAFGGGGNNASGERLRDGIWHPDIFEIDAAAGAANDAHIAFDADGNALALWYQSFGNGTNLWWNYYTAGVGWGTADVMEENDDDIFAGSPRLGFDAEGSALAVWTQTNAAGGTDAWSNRYTRGTRWGTPMLIETDPGEVLGAVELAVHRSGDAVAVWVQFDGTNVNIRASFHDAGRGWEAAEIIDGVDHIVHNPRVALDSDGTALAVWQQSDGNPGSNIWARRRTPASGWEDQFEQISDTIGHALGPRPAMDADGNALVIWAQDSVMDRGIYASSSTAPGEWETPVQIKSAEPGQVVEQQQVAFAPDGSALAVWEHPVNGGGAVVSSVFASRYTPGAGWAMPEVISNADSFYPKIAVDASGHALAVWFELDLSLPFDSAYSVWSNRYTAGAGWTTAGKVGSNGSLIGTLTPNLAIDPRGAAFAIWTRGGDVRVNRFE